MHGVNKRGLSQIVTTVLIILIVIASVVLIWATIRPVISDFSEKLESTGNCLKIDLEVESCTASESSADVVVKRNTGVANLTGIKFIFNDGEEVLDVTDSDNEELPGELESKTFSNFDVDEPSNVIVAGVVEGDVCEPIGSPVECT